MKTFFSHIRKPNQEIVLMAREKELALNCIASMHARDWKRVEQLSATKSPLLTALSKLSKSLSHDVARETDHTWVDQKLAATASLVHNSQHDFNAWISDVTRAIGASQGAIFIKNEDNETIHLELKGSYALTTTRQTIRIEPGHGQVGQCFINAEKIHLTNIPREYTQIGSATGSSTPVSLALLPLKSHQHVAGVIELASLKQISKREFIFLERISEIFAGAIISSLEAKKVQRLLEQSQVIENTLRNREKELQNNLSEMQAIQGEQLRRRQELEKAYQEIERQKAEIENIQKRETELIESKLKTQEQLAERVINKLKAKIEEMKNLSRNPEASITT